MTFEMMSRGKMSATGQTSIFAMTMNGFHVIVKRVQLFKDSVTLRTKKHPSSGMNVLGFLPSFIFDKYFLDLPRKYVTTKS